MIATDSSELFSDNYYKFFYAYSLSYLKFLIVFCLIFNSSSNDYFLIIISDSSYLASPNSFFNYFISSSYLFVSADTCCCYNGCDYWWNVCDSFCSSSPLSSPCPPSDSVNLNSISKKQLGISHLAKWTFYLVSPFPTNGDISTSISQTYLATPPSHFLNLN